MSAPGSVLRRRAPWGDNGIELGIALVAAGGAGLVGAAFASLGLMGLVAGLAGMAFVCGLAIVPWRQPMALAAMVLSLVLLLHKSIGPMADNVHSGAPAVYVTTTDLAIVLLY